MVHLHKGGFGHNRELSNRHCLNPRVQVAVKLDSVDLFLPDRQVQQMGSEGGEPRRAFATY